MSRLRDALSAALLWALPARTARRTSWIYCDCGHDLNGDAASWVGSEPSGLERYVCAGCGARSTWDLDCPVSLRVLPVEPRRE